MDIEQNKLQNFNAGQILGQLFDIVRIVNPMNKCSLTFDQNIDSICYQLWQKPQPCSNCISQRAINEKKSFVKLEIAKEKLFLVMVLPIRLENKNLVLELLKEISPESIYGDFSGKSPEKISVQVKSINNSLVKDELTKIFNKKYIHERLPYEIFESESNNKPLSVIMADIDHFKAVNDTYGHVAGDFVLQELGREFTKQINESQGWPARYGGEEFLICLRDTDRDSAHNVAEKLRKVLEKKEFKYKGNTIKLTSSFGCCTFQGQKISPDELINCADERLYQAKNSGRNRVESSNYLYPLKPG